MTARPLTPRLAEYVAAARDAGLPDPLGRGVALLNRLYNDGSWRWSTPEGLRVALRKLRPSTAARWRRHWRAGGSVKTLARTQAEEALHRKFARHRLPVPDATPLEPLTPEDYSA